MSLSRALIAVLAALFVLPAGANAASSWQAGPSFAESAPATSALSVVGAGDGSTWAAWITIEQQPAGAVSVVVAQRVGVDGTRGPLLRLGTTKAMPTGEIKQDPGYAHISVVATPTGAAVLWLDTKDPDPTTKVAVLKLARLGPAGVVSTTTIDPAASLSQTSSLAPELTANASGDLLLSWWSAAGKPYVQKITAAGSPYPALLLTTAARLGSALRIALLDNGTGRVAYRTERPVVPGDRENKDGGLRVARLTATGTLDREPDLNLKDEQPGELATRVISTGDRQLLGYASLATNGKQVSVVWAEDERRGGLGSGPGTFLTAPLPTTGLVAGPTVRVARDEGVSDMDGFAGTLLTGLSDDGTLTVIRQSAPSPSGFGVVVTRLRAGAAPVDITIAGGPEDPYPYNVLPSLAVARDGTAVVAWVGLKSLGGGGRDGTSPGAVVLAPDGTQGTRYTSSSAGVPTAFMTPSGPRIAVYDVQSTPGRILTRSWLPESTVAPPATPAPAPAGDPAPAPAPAPSPAPAQAPVLTGVTLGKSTFAAGTRVPFSLESSAAGTAKIVITRATKGRKSGKTCKPQTKKNRKAKRCTYDKVLRTLTAPVPAGRATITFDGKVAGKALAVGTYKAQITVTGTSGLTSKPTVITFKITKKKKGK